MKRLMSMVLLLAAVTAIPAAASTFLAMSRGDLVRESGAVVQGEVLKVSSFWSPSGRIIITEALVKVDEAILGEAPSVVVVRTFGGTVGGFRVEAHGFPEFKVSERVLLFLEPEREGAVRVTGYQQGQYRIVRDKAGVDIAVPAAQGGARIVTREGRSAPAPQAMRLETLKNEIRSEGRRSGRLEN